MFIRFTVLLAWSIMSWLAFEALFRYLKLCRSLLGSPNFYAKHWARLWLMTTLSLIVFGLMINCSSIALLWSSPVEIQAVSRIGMLVLLKQLVPSLWLLVPSPFGAIGVVIADAEGFEQGRKD